VDASPPRQRPAGMGQLNVWRPSVPPLAHDLKKHRGEPRRAPLYRSRETDLTYEQPLVEPQPVHT
jgi:hypothetical protein